MTTESHLASLGVTMQEARDFIFANVKNPGLIFSIAYANDVTTAMLSEITGYSTSDISAYFASYGVDATDLDSVDGDIDLPDDPLDSTDDPNGSASATLVNYMAFNDSTGILSTAVLRNSVIAATGTDEYFSAFNPDRFTGAGDGVFTPDELGTARLGNVAATTDNIESLFFGTWIHALKTIDTSEALQYGEIIGMVDNDPSFNPSSPDFLALMDDVFSDPAQTPLLNDSDIAGTMTALGTTLVENVDYSPDVELSIVMLLPLRATFTDFF